jgi:hypothetical protein
MLSAGNSPNAGDRREFALMGLEKITTAIESTQAVASSCMRLNQQVGAIALKQMLTATAAIMSLAMSRTPGQSVARQTNLVHGTMTDAIVATSRLSKSVARVAHRGLKPIHTRVTGNSTRLAKR